MIQNVSRLPKLWESHCVNIPLLHVQALLQPFPRLHCLFRSVCSSYDPNRLDSDIFQSPATIVSYLSISRRAQAIINLSVTTLLNDFLQWLNAIFGLLRRLDYP